MAVEIEVHSILDNKDLSGDEIEKLLGIALLPDEFRADIIEHPKFTATDLGHDKQGRCCFEISCAPEQLSELSKILEKFFNLDIEDE